MKTYDQLNKVQQKAAFDKALNELLTAINEGLRFNDKLNKDDLQARIDKAFAKAERLHTPWFSREIMLEDKYIRSTLEGMAQVFAEDALYPENHEIIIDNIA